MLTTIYMGFVQGNVVTSKTWKSTHKDNMQGKPQYFNQPCLEKLQAAFWSYNNEFDT